MLNVQPVQNLLRTVICCAGLVIGHIVLQGIAGTAPKREKV
jgi:hypothetical protein